MSCFSVGVPPRSGSSFQADALGNNVQATAPVPCARRGPRCEEADAASSCYPFAFERVTIPGYLAQNTPDRLCTDDTPRTDYDVDIRVIKAVRSVRGVFSIGTALSASSWNHEGFIMSGTDEGRVKAVPLLQNTSIGTACLNLPTALVVDPSDGSIVIVGSGYIVDLMGHQNNQMPAVARVNPVTLDVFVQVGNGGAFSCEVYTDIIVAASCSTAPGFVVCGEVKDAEDVSGSVSGSVSRASVRRLDGATLLPLPTGNAGQLYTLLTDDALALSGDTFTDSIAVSLATSQSLDMIVVAVQAGIQYRSGGAVIDSSLLWSLRLDGTPLYPLSVTSFNVLSTHFLATPANVASLRIVSVVVTASEVVYAVSRGQATTGAPMPSVVTVVHAFNADTLPVLPFGVSGVATWWDQDSLGSAPVSALCNAYDGSLLVVGNSFNPLANPSDSSFTRLIPPSLAWLQEKIPPPATSAPYTLASAVTPFLVRFNCVGVACALLRGLPCYPCSTFTWASVFVLTSCLSGILLGDCATKPLAYGQPATVLTAVLNVSHGGAMVMNTARPCGSAVGETCYGVVTVDTKCAPTTLVVNGPVVVGDNESDGAIPGTIRFRDGHFQGYNGTTWVQLDNLTP